MRIPYYLYTWPNMKYQRRLVWVNINGWVFDSEEGSNVPPTPLEDYGDHYLSPIFMEPEKAFTLWKDNNTHIALKLSRHKSTGL